MSFLKDSSISIYEAMMHIKEGRYVMPAFQRQFVWSMEQIEKLWDSILLNYPIATFLFWHVDDNNVTWDTYFCNFLTSVTFDNRKQADSVNYELTDIDVNTTDTAILDGQQRLTSLYLSLFGDSYIREKYARRNTVGGTVTKLLIELNKNKLDVDEEEYNSKKYDIKFSVKVGRLSPTQFELRNILQEKFQNNSTRDKAIEDAIANVPPDSKDYARNLLKTLYHKIFTEKLIRFTEIHDMNQDDALEMFVRFAWRHGFCHHKLQIKIVRNLAMLFDADEFKKRILCHQQRSPDTKKGHAVGPRHQPHTLLYHPAVNQALGVLQRRVAARDRFTDDGLDAVLFANFKIALNHHALAQRKLTRQRTLVFAVIVKADFAAQPANGRRGGKHHPCQFVRTHMGRAFRVAENKANDTLFGLARLF